MYVCPVICSPMLVGCRKGMLSGLQIEERKIDRIHEPCSTLDHPSKNFPLVFEVLEVSRTV